MASDYEIIPFKTQADFRKWLHKNHASVPGIWLKMFKKDSGIESINYKQALDEALCYGWIDGQSKSGDDKYWIQKFTPRRKKSMWSKRNIEHIERLRKEGKMREAGEKEVEAAKADGRWAAAYDGPATIKMPEDFLKELSKDKKAEAFFNTLNKTNTFAIAWQLQTAVKLETRERRFKKLLEMLKKGKKIH